MSVHQENHNLYAGQIEADLFLALRNLCIAFGVYSPVAAEFLVKTFLRNKRS